jgi:hypothetical protein
MKANTIKDAAVFHGEGPHGTGAGPESSERRRLATMQTSCLRRRRPRPSPRGQFPSFFANHIGGAANQGVAGRSDEAPKGFLIWLAGFSVTSEAAWSGSPAMTSSLASWEKAGAPLSFFSTWRYAPM